VVKQDVIRLEVSVEDALNKAGVEQHVVRLEVRFGFRV